MKIVNYLTLLVIGVLVLTSCNNDEQGPGIPTQLAGEGKAAVKLYSASTGTRSPETSQGTADERYIDLLEFYIFNQDGSRDTATDEDGNTEARYVRIEQISTTNQYTFPVTAGEGKTILVAANMNLGSLNNVTRLDDLRARLYNTEINSPLQIPADGIPMAGEVSGVSVQEETVQSVDMPVSRLYTKIEAPKAAGVIVDLTQEAIVKWEETFGQAIQGEVTFRLNSYYVVNGIKNTYSFQNYGNIASEYDRWDANTWTLGGNVDNYFHSTYDPNTGELIEAYSGQDFLTNEDVYVYENSSKRGVMDGIIGFAAPTVYAIIVEGEIADELISQTRYWRINISRTNDYYNTRYQILRNAIYRVNIDTVRTIGEGTPDEGENGGGGVIPDENEAGITATISVADWRVFNQGTDI